MKATLDDIFSHFGIPANLRSDNGPPFKYYEFKRFAEENGFKHQRITPFWPQANGTVERFMRNLAKVIRKDGKLSKNWEEDLQEPHHNQPHKNHQHKYS